MNMNIKKDFIRVSEDSFLIMNRADNVRIWLEKIICEDKLYLKLIILTSEFEYAFYDLSEITVSKLIEFLTKIQQERKVVNEK